MARRADLAAIVALAPVIVLLASLSGASAIAAFTTLPHDAVVEAARSNERVAPAEALAAAAANERAAAFFDAPRYRMEAARVLLALPPSARRMAEPRIERLTSASLTGAPMSPYGWTLLAFLRLDRNDVAGAAAAWTMAVMTGRYVPDLMASRLKLGIRLMPFDADVRAGVGDQVRLLATVDPASLAAFARDAGEEPLVRAMLRDSDGSARFERATTTLAASAGQRLATRARGR